MEFNPDDKKYLCCCNKIHVKRGAFIVGIAGMVFNVVALSGSLIEQSGDWWQLVPEAIVSIVSFLVFMCIIFAHKKQKPALYWPFIVLNAMSIALVVVYIAIWWFMLYVAPEDWLTKSRYMHKDEMEKIIMNNPKDSALIAAFIVFLVLISAWFQYIVYRAYQYTIMTQLNLVTIEYKHMDNET
ncbi:hypothetical protein DdX_15539 [Ditylenchus destructor]|uniref:Uncharacterized protein n=1 Tax=Ditylenchus destructor TaxID=166010 RepID=A0AAD4MS29_9BILA|nr:hypothetical protein DdX_15539 [Ditylenchus destructor]